MQAMWWQMWEPRQDFAPLNDFVTPLLSRYHLYLFVFYMTDNNTNLLTFIKGILIFFDDKSLLK